MQRCCPGCRLTRVRSRAFPPMSRRKCVRIKEPNISRDGIVFGLFFLPQVLFFFFFASFPGTICHVLPCICNSLELEPVILHGICYFDMVTLHFAWCLLHLAMFAFHFAWYLSHFGMSTSHLHGICYILVLQTFMWVSHKP